MRTFIYVVMLVFIAPVISGHSGEEWNEGHTAHIRLLKVEGYLRAEDASITVGRVEIEGKFSIPLQTSETFVGEEYHAWGNDVSDDLYEDTGTSECISSYEWGSKLVFIGPPIFEHSGHTIVLNGITPRSLLNHTEFIQKIKLIYSYQEHGATTVKKKSAWTEC